MLPCPWLLCIDIPSSPVENVNNPHQYACCLGTIIDTWNIVTGRFKIPVRDTEYINILPTNAVKEVDMSRNGTAVWLKTRAYHALKKITQTREMRYPNKEQGAGRYSTPGAAVQQYSSSGTRRSMNLPSFYMLLCRMLQRRLLFFGYDPAGIDARRSILDPVLPHTPVRYSGRAVFCSSRSLLFHVQQRRGGERETAMDRDGHWAALDTWGER